MIRGTGAMSEDELQNAIRARGIVFATVDPRANANSLYRRYRTD
jgi:hypothetical protein